MSPLGALSFGLSTLPPAQESHLSSQTVLRRSVHSFIKWSLSPTSEERLPDLTHKGCPQQQLCHPEPFVPEPCCEVLAEGQKRSDCSHNQLRMGRVTLPIHGDVLKISWSKAEDWGCFNLPVVKLQRNEEMSFAVGILLHSTICWCFRTNAPSCYCLFYILFCYHLFKILSQVSHKRTRARIFGNLAYDI